VSKTKPESLIILTVKHEIVRRVERLFAFAGRLEARWRSAQGQVAALTPSLLAKAFRGELVEREAE
jgi:type I restriction enzyme, S subunit